MCRSIATRRSRKARRGNGAGIAVTCCRARGGDLRSSSRCLPRARRRRAPTSPTLRKVSLPDLSHAAPSVQEPAPRGFAALTRSIDDRIRHAESAAAYGQMGMLLMAAEYRDEAESAYLNAQALAPNERAGRTISRTSTRSRATRRSRRRRSNARASCSRTTCRRSSGWATPSSIKASRRTAEPLFPKALSLQPRSVAAQFGLGRAALAKQDYTRAVEHLEQALSLDPQATVIHYPLAMAYRGVGDTARAEAHLQQRGTLADQAGRSADARARHACSTARWPTR